MNSIVLMLASNLLWLVAAAQQVQSSPPLPLALVAPIDTGISVTVYNIGRHPAFAGFFESQEEARLARYSIVVTNESTKNIVGVAVHWNVTDHNGQN